jgi:hypothetical protein
MALISDRLGCLCEITRGESVQRELCSTTTQVALSELPVEPDYQLTTLRDLHHAAQPATIYWASCRFLLLHRNSVSCHADTAAMQRSHIAHSKQALPSRL